MPGALIYPYLVTPNYPAVAEDRPDRWRPLGHGISVTLVTEDQGMVRNLTDEEAASLPGTFDEIYATAITNLENLLRTGAVKSKIFPRGPLGRPFALFGGHWSAAACLLAPDSTRSSAPLRRADVLVVVRLTDELRHVL